MIIGVVDQILQLDFECASQDFQCLRAVLSLSVSSLSVTSNRNTRLKKKLNVSTPAANHMKSLSVL